MSDENIHLLAKSNIGRKRYTSIVFPFNLFFPHHHDHEGTVGTGGRAITNLHFADDIDGLAIRKKNWQN